MIPAADAQGRIVGLGLLVGFGTIPPADAQSRVVGFGLLVGIGIIPAADTQGRVVYTSHSLMLTLMLTHLTHCLPHGLR